jgi:hypothetical protein
MARPHIEPFVDREVEFKKMTLPGFPVGMHYKMLSIDGDTGACSMTVQYEAGYNQPPTLCYSDVEMLVMEGGLQVGGQLCGPGYYFFVPKGVSLPAITSPPGALCLLMYNETEPHLIESDQDSAGAEREQLIKLQSYEDMPWQVPTLFPQTASGCLLKLLRFDEKTHAMSFLYSMVPGFWQDNISYHDCSEEAYHIYGTSWMMQFGYLPTGGYFYRPPYINHGAFASEHGVLAFGRTDGELHNHFHWNPWSTPAENVDRAAARLTRQKPELHKWIIATDHNHLHFNDFEFLEDSEGFDHAHVDAQGGLRKHKHK